MLGFYRDKLGFELNDIAPGPPAVPLVNWASLRTGSVTLELFDVATYGERDQLHDTGREAVELCFIVDDVDLERIRLNKPASRVTPSSKRIGAVTRPSATRRETGSNSSRCSIPTTRVNARRRPQTSLRNQPDHIQVSAGRAWRSSTATRPTPGPPTCARR